MTNERKEGSNNELLGTLHMEQVREEINIEGDEEQIRKKENMKKWNGDEYKSLMIACHNINGLKTNKNKLENILEWMDDEQIKILGLVETNIKEKDRNDKFFIIHSSN